MSFCKRKADLFDKYNDMNHVGWFYIFENELGDKQFSMHCYLDHESGKCYILYKDNSDEEPYHYRDTSVKNMKSLFNKVWNVREKWAETLGYSSRIVQMG